MKKIEIARKSFLVIGDIMVDEYIIGEVNRISPEAPIPVFKYKSKKSVLGGAANVASNLSNNKQDVYVMSVIGSDGAGDQVIRLLEMNNINTQLILKDDSRKTTVKTRLLADNNQQVVRIDKEDTNYINKELEQKFIEMIKRNINKFNIVLISDYNKGLLTKKLTQSIIKICNNHKIAVIVDPKDKNIGKYKNSTLVKPNKKELQYFTNRIIENEEDLIKASLWLKNKLNLKYLLVTRGHEGMTYFSEDNSYHTIHTQAKEVYDVTGAGDTVLAFIGLAFANNIKGLDAIKIANIAAGIKVEKMGTSVVTIDEVNSKLNICESKIKNREEIKLISKELREKGKKIVFTNGCFDILHSGHVTYLRQAKNLGDILIVGLNSDDSIKRLKGQNRPINKEIDRALLLESIEYVDYLVIFNEDTPYELIKLIKPDILVKGGDYFPEDVVGKEFVESYGGQVKILPYVEGKSSTKIIEKIIKIYNGSTV